MPNLNQKGFATFSLHERGFAHILGLLLLVVGLGVGVYLVQHETKLFSRATSAPIPVPMPVLTLSPKFQTGVNVVTIASYGYGDLKPRSNTSDIDFSLREIQRMKGSLVRVFIGNSQITDAEASRRLGVFLDKAALYKISVIPVFIDYYGGPWDHQSMVNAYVNAACPGGDTNVDLNSSTVTLCNGTKVLTWAEIKLELLQIGYASGHNPQGTDQYYVREGNYGLLNNDFFVQGYKQNFTNFVRTVVTENKNHSNIYAWEIGNELRADPSTFINFAKDVASLIKFLDPSHKVALGMINAGHTGLTANELYSNLRSVDVVTVHAYNGDRSGASDVQWAVSHGKVALIEEIGFSGSGNRSASLREEIAYWKSIGALGVLPWGFIAKGLADNGDGDNSVGFDAVFHTDYDQIFSVLQACLSRGIPTPTPTPSGPICNTDVVSLNVSPGQVNSGQSINFTIAGDASTFIRDDFGGGALNCSGEWNNKTCTAATTPGTYRWIHTWKHCEGSFDNCSGECSKSASFTVVSPSRIPLSTSCSACSANIRADGKVSIVDMMIVARCMGMGPSGSVGKYSCQKADVNGDGKIDAGDLNCAREQFGKQCSSSR